MSQPILKVFSATKHEDRNALGELVTRWLRDNPKLKVEEIRTLQSSDEAYHCLSIIVVGKEGKARPTPKIRDRREHPAVKMFLDFRMDGEQREPQPTTTDVHAGTG